MKDIFARLLEKKTLLEDESYNVFKEIMEEKITPVQAAAFITLLKIKGEQPSEITGAARLLRDKAKKIKTPASRVICDTCGTGGDSSGTGHSFGKKLQGRGINEGVRPGKLEVVLPLAQCQGTAVLHQGNIGGVVYGHLNAIPFRQGHKVDFCPEESRSRQEEEENEIYSPVFHLTFLLL